MDLNFSKKVHAVKLSPRAYGDIEYKQRANWNSKSRLRRERANLMFDRIHQALFNLSNTTDFSGYSKTSDGQYQYTVTDGFVVIIFTLIMLDDSLVVYITNFIWTYKKDPNSWWSIVETRKKHTLHLTEMEFRAVLSKCVKNVINNLVLWG